MGRVNADNRIPASVTSISKFMLDFGEYLINLSVDFAVDLSPVSRIHPTFKDLAI